jgi:MGT family glycosyltransferase
MPKAFFFNVPAHGHVNPSLPLVAELAQRGHQITYFLTPEFRADVEAAGAVLQPYAAVHDDYFSGPGLDGSRPQKAAARLITTAGEILPELLQVTAAGAPDYILYDGMCPWGYLVARSLNLPAVVSLSLLPLAPPPMRDLLSWEMLSVLGPMLLRDAPTGMQAVRRAQALGSQYGVPPLSLPEILNAPGDRAISYTSRYFQPYADRVADTVRFVGWALRESRTEAPFSFAQAEGRRLIYISLGSIVQASAAFFRTCIDAFAAGDEFVLISTGRRFAAEEFGALPLNVAVHTWVPQAQVLRRASLFVTHGGLGSVHDGLYCGVPLLVVPQQEEQLLTARRVVELGAGLLLRKHEVTTAAVRAHASRLLAEPTFAREAGRIGETLCTAGGVALAADEIEHLLSARQNGGKP